MINLMRKHKFTILILILLALIYLFNNHSLFSQSNKYIDTYSHMIVHYIDVGQGDCILVQVNNKNILIDSGPSSSKDKLIKYLNSLDLKRIDYVIATHPHEDHIGNMDDIIKKFSIGEFYAPKAQTSSRTFENMISALKNKNLKINILKRDNNSINLGPNTSFTVYSPFNNNYDNLNNYSPVIKIEYGNSSFLFTGDAEADIENKILSLNDNIEADVLKVGHHGSSTSTSENFLKKINPSIAIISVGENNEFNHPDKSTISRLKNNNVTIYQTASEGTIIISSDGTNITKIK